MHSNANITFLKQETDRMFATVLALQPKTGGSDEGQSPDEVVDTLAKSIEAGLPPILDRENAGVKTFVVRDNGQMDSLATVLGQELVKFNRLLNRMKTSLSDLQKAIKGMIVMTLDLDKMYNSFLINQVPELFASVGFASLKPLGSWVVDLQSRIVFLQDWLEHGPPKAFSMPVFFFPQGFLTGALQNHARKYQIAINALDFKFEIFDGTTENIDEGPEDGVIIYGLYMEGARWNEDSRLLDDSRKGEMYTLLPPVHFIPEKDYKRDPKEFACPAYKTSLRQGVLSTTGISTNFVIGIDMPTEKEPHYWVLRGVALLCNLND
jgi:dynein heavy chain